MNPEKFPQKGVNENLKKSPSPSISMASSESVDDSFRAQVEKVFGSVASSKSSPWSLTDGEIERREWRRDSNDARDCDDTPCSSAFDECFNKDQRASRRKLRRELDDQNDDMDGQPDRVFRGGAGSASGSSG